LMWYITALTSQAFLQGLVRITCLIDDPLPLAIPYELTGRHPFLIPRESPTLLFHASCALIFSCDKPYVFLLSSCSSSKYILTVIFVLHE
jgi:hypothetical protein